MSAPPVLDCRGLTVRFGGVTALSELTLEIRRGELLGIAGPNGAGKTTLFNAISGHVGALGGEVRFNGDRIDHLTPPAIFQRGIARTFQLAELVSEQTVYANVLLGAHFAADRGWRGTLRFSAASYERADAAMERFGLLARAADRGGAMSLFERKMVMLASAMAQRPQVLLLDEPVGGLTDTQADALLDEVRAIAAAGTTVVVIEHVMRVLTSITDRLVILNRGQVVFDGDAGAARRDAAMKELYFGTAAGA